MAILLSTSHMNRQRWRRPQNLARSVTKRRGPVNPPSSLRVELPISIGPPIGPEPVKGTCFWSNKLPTEGACCGEKTRIGGYGKADARPKGVPYIDVGSFLGVAVEEALVPGKERSEIVGQGMMLCWVKECWSLGYFVDDRVKPLGWRPKEMCGYLGFPEFGLGFRNDVLSWPFVGMGSLGRSSNSVRVEGTGVVGVDCHIGDDDEL